MKTKKIKVFLGGYINYINAQNLNCRSIAKHLDKNKFKCAAMLRPNGNLPVDDDLNDVLLFKCRQPIRYSQYITFLRGIIWCDVAYLPKCEIWQFCATCLKWLSKKSFTTVEGVIYGTNLEKSLALLGSKKAICDFYHSTTKTYSITKYMAQKNYETLGIKSDGILYLGVETNKFKPKIHNKKTLQNIIFIGNNIRYKGIEDYYTIAKKFPDLTFHIVGGGIDYDVNMEIEMHRLTNCIYHGLMNHCQIAELLNNMDIHIFPSRSEGFPKVILETASMGVPSIVYNDYGAKEWITSGQNGYVVSNIEDIESIIKNLQVHPELLANLAEEAKILAKNFDWKIIVKHWEKVIETLYTIG